MTELNKRITITNSEKVSMFISKLFHSQTQVHIFHLQTGSFARHKALQEYYEGIGELLDKLAEMYMGEYSKLNNFSVFPFENSNSTNSEGYLKSLLNYILTNRNAFEGTDYQNIIDEITSLIKSTLYKLKLS